MRLSIIIPYYERKELIVNTLRSLNNQTMEKELFEVIIVDDGSGNFGIEDIEQLGLEISVKVYFYPRSEKSGASFARNRGIEQATGEYLIFLDCDMIVDHDYLQKQMDFFSACPERENILQIGMRNDILVNQEVMVNDPSRMQFDKDLRCRVFELYSENLGGLQAAWHLVFSNNISVARQTALAVGGFDEKFQGWGFEDCEFGYKLHKHGVKILYNPNIEAYHQYHEFHWDERRVTGWKKNLHYFIDKHHEVPVMLQTILDEYVDPSTKDTVVEKERLILKNNHTSWMEIWLNCFRRFENALRSATTVHGEVNSYSLTLTNPVKEEVLNKVHEHPHALITVICNKREIEFIHWLQVNKTTARVKLFTY